MDDKDKEKEKDEEETDAEEGRSWLRDNLRIIISIIIVVAIAGGVYSYSKRNQAPANKSAEEQVTGNNEEATEAPGGNENAASNQTAEPNKAAASTATSQETENSFIETAVRGDGQTHLARRALANYLEKNPDSELTAEHKIYIEDYLRKKSGFKGRVYVGTSIEFSKDLISKAIDSSKKLNDKQLKNLHKYAVRVPSLT